MGRKGNASSDNPKTDSDHPSARWNRDPATLPDFVTHLEETVMADGTHRGLVQSGTIVTTRGQTVVHSLSQLLRHADGTWNNRGWDDPFSPTDWKAMFDDGYVPADNPFPPVLVPAVPASPSVAPSAVLVGGAEGVAPTAPSDPALAAAASATPGVDAGLAARVATALAAAAPTQRDVVALPGKRGTTRDLPEEDRRNWSINPRLLEEHDQTLAHEIVALVDDRLGRKELLQAGGGSGLGLLAHLRKECSSTSARAHSLAIAKRTALVRSGVEGITMESWNLFRDEYELANGSLPKTLQHQDRQLAWRVWCGRRRRIGR